MYAMKNSTFRMSRLLIAACLTLCALPAMAQYYGDDDEYGNNEYSYEASNTYRDPRSYNDYIDKKWFKTIRAGANFSTMTNTGSMGDGYDASIAFIYPMSKVYFMTEVGVSMRSCSHADLVDFDHHPAVGNFRWVHFDAMGHNVKVRPVQFGTMIGGGGFSLDPHVGCFASYDYYSKNVVDNYSSFQPEYDTLPELNRLDYGINAGLGMYVWRFNFDFTYEHGFADFFKTRTSKTNQFTVRLGFMF